MDKGVNEWTIRGQVENLELSFRRGRYLGNGLEREGVRSRLDGEKSRGEGGYL